MHVRQVEVRGCLPTILALVVVGAVLTLAVSAGAALLTVAVLAGLVAAIGRWLGGLGGRAEKKKSGAQPRASDATIDVEVVERPGEADDGSPRRLE